MLFNRARALEYMKRYGVEVLVAASPVNVTYLSDYFCWINSQFKEYMMTPGASSHLLPGAYAIFPSEGEPALLVNSVFAVNADNLWVKDVQVFGGSFLDESLDSTAIADASSQIFSALHDVNCALSPVEKLIQFLRDRGLGRARIGLEMEGMTASARDAIVQGLPGAEIRDCSSLLRLIRMVKGPEEIVRLKQAAEINERAAMSSLALAQPGVSVSSLVQHFREQTAMMGATFDHFVIGLRGMGIASDSSHVLEAEDICYVDFGCIYKGYFADSGTTRALGPLPPNLLARHAALRACVDAAFEIMRPGVKASEVRAAMWAALGSRGITASFPHGHGLGLEARDYPILVANNGLRIEDQTVSVPSDLPLEVNMVINLESAIFMPNVASVHIEKSFLITSNGCEPLVPQDRSCPVTPMQAN
jgi:Xaa-Pro dipeptidase